MTTHNADDVCPKRPQGHEWYMRVPDRLAFCMDCGFGWKPAPTLESRLRQRIAEDDGTRYTLDEVAEMLGVHIDGTVTDGDT